MSTGGIHVAVAELLSFSRALPNKRLISSCRRGITPHGSCRITELMALLLLVENDLCCNPAEASLGNAAKLVAALHFSRPSRSFFGGGWRVALRIARPREP